MEFSVLIVDDQEDICGLMSNVISSVSKKIDVKSISEKKAVLSEICDNDYDLVFMDINLGEEDYDGVQTLVKLREQRPEQKVYMMTGYPVSGEKKEEIESHALGLLNKPFHLQSLLDIIESHLKE